MGEQHKDKHILIVDDDPVYATMVYEWLKEKYEVTTLHGGREALSWMSEHTVDLVLLDYEMPEMPGAQVMEKIKDDPAKAKIPVMILTGKNDRESIMRILSLGPKDYLLKNISPDELQEKVAGCFRKRVGRY